MSVGSPQAASHAPTTLADAIAVWSGDASQDRRSSVHSSAESASAGTPSAPAGMDATTNSVSSEVHTAILHSHEA